jgi:hypothetical protein
MLLVHVYSRSIDTGQPVKVDVDLASCSTPRAAATLAPSTNAAATVAYVAGRVHMRDKSRLLPSLIGDPVLTPPLPLPPPLLGLAENCPQQGLSSEAGVF